MTTAILASSVLASSSSSDNISNHSTPPSSICSLSSFGGDEDHFDNLQYQLGELVQRLLKEKKDQECIIEAWKVRCGTLESECVRLAGLVGELEAKEEARKRIACDETPSLWSPPCTSQGTDSPRAAPKQADKAGSESQSSPSPVMSRSNSSDWRSSSSASPKTETRRKSSSSIPQIDPTKSMSKQNPPPCNSFYLLGACSVPRCKYCHLYKLTPAELEEMKRGAKFHLCNALKNSGKCDDLHCIFGHSCPKGAACARTSCDFNDVQHKGPAVAKRAQARATKQ